MKIILAMKTVLWLLDLSYLKQKKILALSILFEANKNIDLTISTAKPPIFWKDKEITNNKFINGTQKI